MFQQTQFLDIVFLLIVALFLISRLRAVLGTRPERTEEREDDENVVDISDYRTVNPDGDGEKADDEVFLAEHIGNADAGTAEVFEKIKKIDPAFSMKNFLNKASKAFEYIAVSFASGDKSSLKPLVSADLYEKFAAVIDERTQRGETVEFSLIGFKDITVVKAELYGNVAELTVEFVTEQTNLVKDENGTLISGDPTYIETVMDIWTLRKDLKEKTPVWTLTATKQKAA